MSLTSCPVCKKGVSSSAVGSKSRLGHSFRPAQAFVAQRKPDRPGATPSSHPTRHSKSAKSARCAFERNGAPEAAQQPLGGAEESSTPVWDVVGLGQPMVDFSASVEDDLLVRLGIVKGSRRYFQLQCLSSQHIKLVRQHMMIDRRVISAQQRAEVLQALEATPYQASGAWQQSLLNIEPLATFGRCS